MHVEVEVARPFPVYDTGIRPKLRDALRRVKVNVSKIFLGVFNAQVGNNAGVWKGVIGQCVDANLNVNGRILLRLSYNNVLCIMNTFFQHRDLHKYTWCRNSLGQRSLFDFCIVSTDLFRSSLDVRVKGVKNYQPIITWCCLTYVLKN